jgi:hypothetical protein
MVSLVVTKLNHDSHEPKGPELGCLLRIARAHSQLYALRQVFRTGVPADHRKFARMRRKHALDRFKGSTLAGYRDLDALVQRAFDSNSMQRHFGASYLGRASVRSPGHSIHSGNGNSGPEALSCCRNLRIS